MVCIKKISVKICGNFSVIALIRFVAYASFNTIPDHGMTVMICYIVLKGMDAIINNHIHTLLNTKILRLFMIYQY